MKTSHWFKGFLGIILFAALVSGCSSSGNSSANAESICTTLNTSIEKAEEGATLVALNRTLGGSEDQISPSGLDVFGLPLQLREAGIDFVDSGGQRGAVEKFLEVAGSCLSADAFQYYSNYLD
jgi:hypothetical protein